MNPPCSLTPAGLAALAAGLLGLSLLAAAPVARACPTTTLGDDTSTARLEDVSWRREGGVYLLELRLLVHDHPSHRLIKVNGKPVKAQVEHWTPFTLAHWLKDAGLLFGGSSKFIIGAIKDTERGEVAVIPYCSIKRLDISQGPDFDRNAPFHVQLQLACLHPPVPFTGKRRAYTPLTGVGKVDDYYVQFIENRAPQVFDPYGQSYGDYFADLWYLVSFVHGPVDNGEFTRPDNPMPATRTLMYSRQSGWKLLWSTASMYDHTPASRRGPSPDQSGTLYDYVAAAYAALNPTTTLEKLKGRPVLLAMAGDRSLVPPFSPYSDYRSVCRFEPGRFFTPPGNSASLLVELYRNPPSPQSPWPSLDRTQPLPLAMPDPQTNQDQQMPRLTRDRPSEPSMTSAPAPAPATAPTSTPAQASPMAASAAPSLLLLLACGLALFVCGLLAGLNWRRRRS